VARMRFYRERRACGMLRVIGPSFREVLLRPKRGTLRYLVDPEVGECSRPHCGACPNLLCRP
jgi:hypothetical protein